MLLYKGFSRRPFYRWRCRGWMDVLLSFFAQFRSGSDATAADAIVHSLILVTAGIPLAVWKKEKRSG